jgi:hypothetical protein
MEGRVNVGLRRFNLVKANTCQSIEWEEGSAGLTNVIGLTTNVAEFGDCQRVSRISGREVQQAAMCGISGGAVPFGE